ncbi:ATP-binding cassette sub-family C member 10 [Frieseomelitta varia]|uniref:ATP-binding cassette sub-family C member 10 n=1 Tax=Frieseomelitta varia TaxID=561572 RepID=UPI001CB6B1A3|nr:ATP-binding cassette sub-family C member 10 [Frieseomelitta varia]XP_043508428.1 ATP-binding cassette sub-family C member 10 [Frieseomelitta varia]XP_043508429.1 ATP-binding cassette sub-family C member 10 [Frieseomelitta varia]XP_043508431.1 ATP-binding cassette sub-family C member 10 [Frieseomelitta varia]XP_043508432.1 ATP-binding cassette sub-family C member 10 [Frieseomelitta varia]
MNMDNWLIDDGEETWKWNWTELCGYHGDFKPLNPDTRDLDVCFQQLCLQIPVLTCIAIISAYHCGKRNIYSIHHFGSNYVIKLRIIITMCLIILPILRAYIILSNTVLAPSKHTLSSNNSIHIITSTERPDISSESSHILYQIQDKWNHTIDFAKSILFPKTSIQNVTDSPIISNIQKYNPILITVKDKTTSAKPIDYLVAGTEGIAWVVHLCFIMNLRKGRNFNPRGPVLIRALIFLLIVISILLLRSHIKYNPQNDVLPDLSLGFSISVVTLLILYAVTLIPGHNSLRDMRSSQYNEIGERTALLNSPNSSYIRFPEEQDPTYLGIAMENATIISKLIFHWVNPLMEKGVHGSLNNSDDLFDLPEYISTNTINQKIDKHLQNMQSDVTNRVENFESILENNEEETETHIQTIKNKITLFKLLHKCFGCEFYFVGILKFITDSTSFLGPLLLNKLIGFIEDKSEPVLYGYLYASLIFISALIGAFCNTHFTFWMSVIGLKIRSTVVTLLYRKILHSSNVQMRKQFNFGEIVNFMSTDSDRLVNSCASFHAFWSIPLQLIVALYFLYKLIGVSFLAGITFAVVLIPINKVIANQIGKYSTKLMEWKDRRVRLIGETLRGITTIKLNVWEDHFLRNILKLRENEIKYLRGRKYLDALCVYFWATTPVLISILTFATYVLLGNKLDAKTVFTSMALLNMLIAPLNAFPWILNGLTEAWVSLKRIQRMLDLPDIDLSSYYSEPPPRIDLMLQDIIFSVNGNQNTEQNGLTKSKNVSSPSGSSESKKTVTFEGDGIFNLNDISITVPKGHLIGIMGEVGSGKSLLFDGILGEIIKVRGIIAVNDSKKGFAYVKQNPWLQRGTIRENILFGKPYDYNKYKNILAACALSTDLNSLPKKDLTLIGEAGNTLSGGQKTRISLARAIYADKDIYLLDDVLATLDPKVASYVFKHVIMGLLNNKTRLLCTHQTRYLMYANLVLEMSKGRIINQGKPSDVLSDLEDYLLSSDSIESDLNIMSANDLPTELYQINRDEKDVLLDEEYKEKGKIRLGVYNCYIKAIGPYLAISIILSMFLMQSSKNVTDLWLSYWVTHVNINVTNITDSSSTLRLQYFFEDYSISTDYYLTVYALLAVFNTIFTLMRAFIFAYSGIQAAICIHKQLLKIIVRAKAIFFDVQPFGSILNRFSSDTYTVDDSLPFIANILFAQLFGLIATIIVVAYGLPWILLVLAPLIPVYHWIQNHYRLTSRELKRLSSAALSPLYAHFNETLHGLSTIRAFRTVSRFEQENELLLEISQKTQFASFAVSQWLALRLQLIGVALLAGVSNIAVLQHQYNIADPGLIGLIITYTLSVTGLLSGVVNAFTETEREMIAVERVKQYLENIPIETVKGENPPYAWPSQGVIEFRDVVLKYREHLVPSLNGISFITRPAEKIGIVGRTGAGKSSLFASLFRLTEITVGSILIDNVNIETLQLNAIRSRLAIIPQNPFLFSGTIRENLDPLNQYPDLQIYKAIEKCKIHSLVYRLGGFGATLDEGGSNLSAGQRQLFCLVRAILHNAKIVCIDEATANVDQETDKFIQATIKSSFQTATVFTIAHRIRTIMYCDRVLVLGDGEVLEFDEPNLLIENIDSHFYHLINQEFSDKE